MIVTKKIKACNLIIFGAKGDLANRKLLPSLYTLEKKNMIHKNTKIIGIGRANWTKKDYINTVYLSLKKFNKEKIKLQTWKKLKNRLNFCNIDVNNKSHFIKLKSLINCKDEITINYFAMPPNTFKNICKGLKIINLNNKNTRIIIEKPIGTSLKSSQEINNQISKYFNENQIFRIDHYLGKETILNLLALRFANPIFYNNWDYKVIDHIQITVAEEVGIENRWNYFDQIGQMRDMIQNHLLQILTIIAMSPPNNLDIDNIRDEKIKILKSLKPINYKNAHKKTVRGQYISGIIKGEKVPGYLEEIGAKKNSNTETFVSIKINIDDWRWSGVPFYLRTGKRLPMKYSEIVIYFKKTSINLFKKSINKLPNNKLIIRLQPNEGINIQILNKIPGLNHKYKLQITNLELNYLKTFNCAYLPDAYERLLLECMKGIQSLFVRKDEIEESWKWVDSIINAWSINNQSVQLYKSGTWGPLSSIHMINKDGREWNIN